MTETEQRMLYEKKLRVYPEDERFGEMMCCAVRYALGRMSYVVYDVCNYITPLIPALNIKTLQNICNDITEHEEVCNLGMEMDAKLWLALRTDIIRELKSRGEFYAEHA